MSNFWVVGISTVSLRASYNIGVNPFHTRHWLLVSRGRCKSRGACDILGNDPGSFSIVGSYSWNWGGRRGFVAVGSSAPAGWWTEWSGLVVVKGLVNPSWLLLLLKQVYIVKSNSVLLVEVEFFYSVWVEHRLRIYVDREALFFSLSKGHIVEPNSILLVEVIFLDSVWVKDWLWIHINWEALFTGLKQIIILNGVSQKLSSLLFFGVSRFFTWISLWVCANKGDIVGA